MASNITTASHTKHVDVRYKYVNEYVEDGVINIIFVQSTDNDSSILTKNLSVELHKKQSRKIGVKSFKMLLASKVFELKQTVLEIMF